MTRIATQATVNTGTDTFDYVTADTLNNKTALESRRGVAEIATQTETNTGTDDTRIVTPLKLQTRLGLLGSDDITNDSTVTGATVSDALETLDAGLNTGVISNIRASQTSNATTTNQAFMPDVTTLQESTTYLFEGLFFINGVQTEGVVIEIAGDTGTIKDAFFTYSTNNVQPVNINNRTSFSTTNISITIPSSEVTATGFIAIYMRGNFRTDGTPANMTFDFRKVATVSQPIIMDEGSWIRLTPGTDVN